MGRSGDDARDNALGPEPEDWTALTWEELHAQVVAAHPMAADELCRRAFSELRRMVRGQVCGAQRESIESGIDDALVTYLTNPRRYDTEGAPILRWLSTIAANKARDVERQRRRIDAHEVGKEAGDLARSAGPATANPGALLEAWRSRHRRKFLGMVRNERDRRFAELHLDRAPLEVQAEALGVGTLSPDEQRHFINRTWERIATAVKRRWQR